jgi:hypothetical protein
LDGSRRHHRFARRANHGHQGSPPIKAQLAADPGRETSVLLSKAQSGTGGRCRCKKTTRFRGSNLALSVDTDYRKSQDVSEPCGR